MPAKKDLVILFSARCGYDHFGDKIQAVALGVPPIGF